MREIRPARTVVSRAVSEALGCGAARSAGSLPSHARDNGPIRRCRLQRLPLATVTRIAEEFPVPRGRGAIGARIETRAHKPAMGARRGLVDAANAPPASGTTRPGLLLQRILLVKAGCGDGQKTSRCVRRCNPPYRLAM